MKTIESDMSALIQFLMIALITCFIGCSTASAQSLTHDEIRTILKLESSYRACKQENAILSRKASAYSNLLGIRNAQIKNYEQVLTNQAEVELNLQNTITAQQKIITSEQRRARLFKGAFFVSVGLIPASLIFGAIYSPL